jgi:hypothetical protein
MQRHKSLLILLLVPVTAQAEPVYLNCAMDGTQFPEKELELRLDEATLDITHTQVGGRSFNATGTFSANEIKYQFSIPSGDGLETVVDYAIDRTTLAIAEAGKLQAVDPDIRARMKPPTVINGYGTCSVVVVEGRKI